MGVHHQLSHARITQGYLFRRREAGYPNGLGLLDHDLPHAGELSLLLGADGMPGVEI